MLPFPYWGAYHQQKVTYFLGIYIIRVQPLTAKRLTTERTLARPLFFSLLIFYNLPPICQVFCLLRGNAIIGYNILGGVIDCMRIYMDACCLNRPYDDLSQDRIYLEAEAVLSIISHCEKGKWTLIASGAIDFELSNLFDTDRQEQVQMLYAAANERIKMSSEAEQRAVFFQKHGLKPFDSLHLALAETSGADIFLTTDDRLLRTAQKTDLRINIANPVSWLMEVINDGK